MATEKMAWALIVLRACGSLRESRAEFAQFVQFHGHRACRTTADPRGIREIVRDRGGRYTPQFDSRKTAESRRPAPTRHAIRSVSGVEETGPGRSRLRPHAQGHLIGVERIAAAGVRTRRHIRLQGQL